MRLVLIAFEGAQGLDVFGPAEVFAAVNRRSAVAKYEIVLASAGGGRVRASSGITLGTEPLDRLSPRRGDTVLVVGGDAIAIRSALCSAPLVTWLAHAASVVRRIGSVCSGAFLLARAGILDGRRAATHWSAHRELSAFRPAVTVDADAIFVQDGKVWTSAGVTTGIDMALALVEEDLGRKMANAVAAQLVVYARRPGFQSQFSDALIAQTSADQGLGRALEWARKSPGRKLDVSQLARSAGMSVRTLHRRCLDEVGTTPAKLIERLRSEHARLLISTTQLEVKVIAVRSGFENPARMARAFQRTFGLTPRECRALFGHDQKRAGNEPKLGRRSARASG